MSSSVTVSARALSPRTLEWPCSMKLCSQSVTVAVHPSFLAARPQTSYQTLPTIYGAQPTPPSSLQAAAVSKICPPTTAESSPEVCKESFSLIALTNYLAAPAKLDTSLMTEPRMIHGAPRVSKTANTARRKPLPSLMNGLAISPPS